eukprot:m.9177 g.9177  ORF g.9177 m.9177 type:complete len:72 (+) comp3428_c0_seq2:205-420(+)
MSAIFNFQSLLVILVLLVCSCTFLRGHFPQMMDNRKDGPFSIFWKFARIGERLSPYVALSCFMLAGFVLWS